MDKPQLVYKPDEKLIAQSEMTRFMKAQGFTSYSDLYEWSIAKPDSFWTSLFSHFKLVYEGSLSPAYKDLSFDSYTWFSSLRLNFAENLLKKDDSSLALIAHHESGMRKENSYHDLRVETGALASHLKTVMKEGEVLAAYMPNIPETVISMLATTSFGGIFTSTSCDFGVEGVVDRFLQSEPVVLVAAVSYNYQGKVFDQREKIKQIANKIPSLKEIILVDFLNSGASLSLDTKNKIFSWQEATKEKKPLAFTRLPFAHPLYIMYSSGTTGKPKCIVHSVGGTLLQHIKEIGLHCNAKEGKNIFFFTTCGWMMWNWLVSSLTLGARVHLYEGSPTYPSIKKYFSLIETENLEIFGTSPKFLKALEDSKDFQGINLMSLETIISTGSPLLPEQFDFVYSLKKNLHLMSISGGTDIIGCFMLGNPNLPVYRGEIQCLGLGMAVDSFDEEGKSIRDREGELVCKHSFPSRPLYFLHDVENRNFKSAYFSYYKNIWTHGDFITLSSRGTVKVHGRSDATLNPGGVRIGTSEIYRQTELLNFIEDSLCVGRPIDGDVEIVLFVKLKTDEALSEEKIKLIKEKIRQNTTPRHVPKHIFKVGDIPYTRSGKKMELLIYKIFLKKEISNLEALSNPVCLEEYSAIIKSFV
jgi:acetoacetyl-CoA synthetase